MTTRVVNAKREKFDVYVGRRGSHHYVQHNHRGTLGADGYFGNPYTVRQYGPDALRRYRVYFHDRLEAPEFRARVVALRGLTLGCFCKPGPCHGDVIAKWVDAWEPETLDEIRAAEAIADQETG